MDEILIILPTYNNAKTLFKLVESVKRQAVCIMVVDDGSTDDTPEILKTISGVKVVTHPINLGKGAALRTGLTYARNSKYEFAITLDTDGQHAAEDLPILIAAIEKDTIILGDRQLETAVGIPWLSRFGRKISDFWVKVETGVTVVDSQSGFRVYPVQKIPLQKLHKNKFDFEIDILVKSLWSGCHCKSVPITVYYPPAEQRVTHFHLAKDNLRLIWLHTTLVTCRILRSLWFF